MLLHEISLHEFLRYRRIKYLHEKKNHLDQGLRAIRNLVIQHVNSAVLTFGDLNRIEHKQFAVRSYRTSERVLCTFSKKNFQLM